MERNVGSANTLKELLALAKKGDVFVIVFPSRVEVAAYRSSVLQGIPGKHRLAVETVSRLAAPGGKTITVPPQQSVSLALGKVRRELAGFPSTDSVQVELSPDFGKWMKQSGGPATFISSLSGTFQKKKIRSFWLVSALEVDGKDLSTIKSTADYYLHIQSIGSELVAQLLKAPHTDPSLFRPTLWKLDGEQVTFDPLEFQSASESRPVDLTGQAQRDALIGAAFASSGIAQVIFRLDRPEALANPKALSLLKCGEKGLPSLHLADYLLPEQRFTAFRHLSRLRRKGLVRGELSLLRADKKKILVSFVVTRVDDHAYLASLEDVTASRKASDELVRDRRKVEELLDHLPDPVAVFDRQILVYRNSAFAAAFNPLIGQDGDITMGSFLGKKTQKNLGSALKENERVQLEWPVTFPDGNDRVYKISAIRFDSGRTNLIQCLFHDISLTAQQLKQVFESEHRFKTMIDGAAEPVSLSVEDRIVYANESFLKMFGYQMREELDGALLSELVPDLPSQVSSSQKKTRSPEQHQRSEIRARRRDGTPIHVEVAASSVKLNGTPALLAHYHDISVRKDQIKKLERQVRMTQLLDRILRESGESLVLDEVLSTSLRACMKSLGMDAGAVYTINPGSREVVLSLQEGLSESACEILSILDRDGGMAGFVLKTLEPQILTMSSYPAHLPLKKCFEAEQFVQVVFLPLISGDDATAMMMLASRRVRELSEAEQGVLPALANHLGRTISRCTEFGRLQESEERYRTSVENSSDVIYHLTSGGSVRFISANVERLTGYPAAEFSRNTDFWRTVIHPDDRSKFSQRISNQERVNEAFHLEYRVLPKGKASYRWIRDSVRYVRDNQGLVESISGTLSDITDQVNLEAALIKSEQLKTSVVESIQEGVFVLDSSLSCLDWNKAMELMTGVAREEVMTGNILTAFPEHLRETLDSLLAEALAGRVSSSQDLDLSKGTGDPAPHAKHLWVRCSPLRDTIGEIKGVVGIVTDVSSRKGLEDEIRESEETMRNVIDAMGDALMISDLQGRVWEVNREFSNLTGFPRSEALGLMFPYPWLLDEEMSSFVKWIAALREKNYLRDFDMTWLRKDGHRVAISLNTTLLSNASGEPVAMLNIGRDISDRKRMGNQLEQKNLQIELLNRIISKANTTIDFSEIFSTIAREVLSLVPYDQINVGLLTEDGKSIVLYAASNSSGREVPVGRVLPLEESISSFVVQGRKPVLINDLRGEGLDERNISVREGFNSHISIPIFLSEQVIGAFNIANREKNAFSREQLSFLQPIADQIGAMVDRVRLFKRVSDDSAYIHNLVNSIDSVVFTVNRDHRITEANKAWRDFAPLIGLPEMSHESAILGKFLGDIFPSATTWTRYQNVMENLFSRSLEVFTEELEFPDKSGSRTYQLAITPMHVSGTVTGLVFAYTDVTEIKRTEREIKQRNKELVALNTISTSINRSLDLDQVLRVACTQIHDMLAADFVLFYLRDEVTGHLRLSQSVGLSDEYSEALSSLATDTSATGMVITNRMPLYIGEGAAHDVRVSSKGREVFAMLGIQSLGAIPLQSKDRVLGVMDVAFPAPRVFGEQEQQLLLLIGNQIGAAIENAQLYSEVQAQVQRITSLYELGKKLTGALDSRTLLQAVSLELSRALPMTNFSYMVFVADSCSVATLYERSLEDAKYFGPKAIPALVTPDSQLWQVVVEGKSLRVLTGEHGLPGQSMLAVPVRSTRKIIGVMSVSAPGQNAFSEAHLRLLESIANLTEIAIEKATLYEDTVAKSQEIEARNKELDDFTYVVSHDLKEPLISIEGYSKILLNDYKEKVDAEGKEYLGSVILSTSRMKGLIDDLLTLSRLGRVEETLQQVSAGEVVREILHELRFLLQEKGVEVIVEGELPDVRFNRTQLSMVFRNLISNALKFNNKPDPTIRISCRPSDDHFSFQVADNGIGIDRQYFDKIFMIFQRLQRSEEFRGTGAGLTIVKKIVEKHHGRIWVDSTIGEGTTFFFTVPRNS